MPHRHPMALGLLILAYVIVANFAADAVAGAFPDIVAVRGAKQAITGA